jgi:putative ABC transport system ATP-binding protein
LFRYVWVHSRREQLFVLGLIAASLPFYWLSLEIPKRIINDALLGGAFREGETKARLFELSFPLPSAWGGELVVSKGILFDQIDFLVALSFLFLFFVLVNGAFKYGINILKGMLAERMLRRLRFELFTTMLRLRPEDLRAIKPAEAASMIKDEVEPIGGFTGDAFIQPAFLSTQALTALIFIVLQSFWLGMVALTVVLIQAFVIPYLRREQLRLGRLRQIAARHLAGRIGEMVDRSRTIQSYALKTYSEAEIGSRLGNLFKIRADLYKRKFFVKYLNTILAQTTPFFFYVVGGYLALRGHLDLGQLVAAIAAYRDLPPPIKELIDWEQRRADVSIKYEQVIAQLAGRQLLPDERSESGPELPDLAEPISVTDLTVNDRRGQPLVAGATLTIARPAYVAIVGTAGSGRDFLARAIGRQITDYEGRVCIGERDVRALSFSELSAVVSYVPPEPELFSGTIRDNILLSLLHCPPRAGASSEWRWREARRTGNPTFDETGDWCDYAAAGVGGQTELEDKIIDLLRCMPVGRDLYSYGLKEHLPADAAETLKERVVRNRHEIRARLEVAGLASLIEPFELTKFNPQATLGENIIFGMISAPRLAGIEIARDPYLRSVLDHQALTDPLLEIGLRVAENAVEVFADLPPGHPLFERFSMIRSSDLEMYAEIVDESRLKQPNRSLATPSIDRLISLAFGYIEVRHRMGLVTPELEARILAARQHFREGLPDQYLDEIEFYDPDRLMAAAPLGDNLLFGRVAHNVANADDRIARFLESVLPALDMDRLVYSLGLEFDVGPNGQTLFAPQRAAISIARGLISQPQILILEDALTAFSDDQRALVLATIGRWMQGKTLILTASEVPSSIPFDLEIKVDGARVVAEARPNEERFDHAITAGMRVGDDSPDATLLNPMPNATEH